jgi:hypothetical protein
MTYAVEMGSGDEINLARFIKTGSTIQKLIGEGPTQTDKQHGVRISLPIYIYIYIYFFFFFQNKKTRLK